MVAAACGACGARTGADPGVDAGSNVAVVDADPHAPDADPNAPDARPGTPDAKPDPVGTATVFTIVMENHDYAEIVSTAANDAGAKNAPYINSLIKQYGLATNYQETGSPSLPNYLHMISGDNQYPGIIDVDPTNSFSGFPVKMTMNNGDHYDNIGHQLTAANIPWRSYQESMGTPCKLSGSGPYAPKHDPFLYFDNIQNGPNDLCAKTNVDYAASFATDLAAGTYRYMWITPNLNSDGHDPGGDPVTALKNSDTWLKNNVPAILASDGFKNGGVLFLTWDEAEGRNGHSNTQIPMIVISPRIKSPGMTSATAFDHTSYAATIEDLFNLPRLPKMVTAKPLTEFLNP
jgi:phosphatidylinositol-3-phosphatase